MSIIKDVSEITTSKPYIIIETKIPWKAHHSNTVLLGSGFNGNVILKTKKAMYYIGDATGLSPPIMLGQLYNIKSNNIQNVHTSEIVSVVIRRLQNKKVDIPDVQPYNYEKLARSAIWSIAMKNGLMDKWIKMEKDRVKLLFDSYSMENIILLYPMIKSKNTAMNDVEMGYVNGNVIPLKIPCDEVFQWVVDILCDY